jgi:hypothetical protein
MPQEKSRLNFLNCQTTSNQNVEIYAFSFCLRDCLRSYVNIHTDGFLLCPFKSDQVDCENYLKDFEIKFLLNDTEYEIFLLKYLKQIEAKLEKPFHCKTLDCMGFFNIVDPNIKYFHCPLCKEVNCIQCNAIHRLRTCFEYKQEVEKKQMVSNHDEGIEVNKKSLNKIILLSI